MTHNLIGKITKSKALGWANRRFERCRDVLKRHDINFPPFYNGTLNIKLEEGFLTPDRSNVIHISEDELYEADPHFMRESWNFIPVLEINGKKIKGYIYRTSTNYHGNFVVELITENLNGVIDLSEGADGMIKTNKP